MLRLLTIPISHYCEKVRWALERAGLEYVEERHIQGLHYPWAWQMGRTAYVPVLKHGKTVVSDSAEILRYVDSLTPEPQRLFTASFDAEAQRLEQLFDDVLGVETRRWVYFHFTQTPVEMIDVIAWGTPAWEKPAMRLLFPMMKKFVDRRLDITREKCERGMQRVEDIVTRVERMLADGRPYLLGEQFSALDLGFACMYSPFVSPPEYGIPLPEPEQMSPEVRDRVARSRVRPAGQFALRMFTEERPLPPRLRG